MTFYRKYRPQSLEDLLGQENVKNTLENAFKEGKISHAYLFAGPRGSGKTSTARILAKMVNCELVQSSGSGVGGKGKKSPNPEPITPNIPCNLCSSCLSITDGSNLDLIEIDAASNRGIDDIRTLRENIKLSPTTSAKKVYIIDEVHMLTTEAFNALLKTLEEPPAHVLFILATTEPHKIPQTIMSRVQTLTFHRATTWDLVTAMKKAVEEEKIKTDDEALNLIAKKAEGSFRDALKLLDQLSSSSSEITKNSVEESFKGGKLEDTLGLVEAIIFKDTKKGLELISNLDKKSINFKEFTNSLIETFRQMLLINSGAQNTVKEDLGSKNFPEVNELAQKISPQKLIKILELLSQSLQSLKFSPIPSLPLEIAVVESTIENVSSETHQTPETRSLRGVSEAISKNFISSSIVIPESPAPIAIPEQTSKGAPDDDVITEEVMLLKDKWQFILETVKPYNYSLEALLRQAKIVSCENGEVILEVPYSFHQRILQAPKSRTLLESVLSDVLGKGAKVNTIISKRVVKVEELANVELAADDEIIQIAAEIFNS